MIKNNLLTRSSLDREREKEQRWGLKTQNNSHVLEHSVLTSVKKNKKRQRCGLKMNGMTGR